MATKLRPIKGQDLELIMNWRMRPDITKYMNTDPVLTLETQKQWLKNINKDVSCKYWLIQVDEVPAGIINICNIDCEEKTCEWGYYIGENKVRSLKLALNLEWNLYHYVFDILNFKRLYSRTFEENKGVIKLHVACGSRIEKVLKNFIYKNGKTYHIVEMAVTQEEWNEKKKLIQYDNIEFV